MRTIPFLLMAMALTIGIHIYEGFPYSGMYLIPIGISIILYGCISSFQKALLPFFLILACYFGLKMHKYIDHEASLRLESFNPQDSILTHTIVIKMKRGKRYNRATCRHITTGQSVFAFISTKLNSDIHISDTLVLQKITSISSPTNPNEFDFKHWAKRKGIEHVAWLKNKADFEIIKSSGWSFTKQFQVWSEYVEAVLEKCVLLPSTLGLMKGVLLGIQAEVQEDQKSTFTRSGTLHVMAVSGLHVGIIAGLLSLLFGSSKLITVRWSKSIVIILGVWVFVMITGARPSAIRAALMFTVFQLGWTSMRTSQPLNTLGFCCLIFICSNPLIIYDIGFQFSVTAVLSILLFYPLLIAIHSFSTRGIQFIWQLTCLNLSVQILLGPLSAFYFHQFPSVFLLTNIVAIPIITIMVFLGCILLITSIFSIEIAQNIGMIISGLDQINTQLLDYIMAIPGSLIQDIWIRSWHLNSFLLSILLWRIALTLNYAWIRKATIGATMIIFLLFRFETFARHSQQEIIVYSGKLKGRVDLYDGQHLHIWAKDALKDKITGFQSYKNFRNESIIFHPLNSITTIRTLEEEIELHPNRFISITKIGRDNSTACMNRKIIDIDYLKTHFHHSISIF